MPNMLLYIFFLIFFSFYNPVKGEGYICDFSSEKYNIYFDEQKDDVICYHEIYEGDSIGIIIPRYKEGNENIYIKTNCFNEVSLESSGNNALSIYDIFNDDEITLYDQDSIFYTEYISSILHIKKVKKNTYLHCVFESKDVNGLTTHKGIAKITIKNVKHNENKKLINNDVDNNSSLSFKKKLTNKLVIDLLNKIDIIKDDKLNNQYNNDDNKFLVEAKPGDILYLLGVKRKNKKYLYVDQDCPLHFERIGSIYKYIFPIINEKEEIYNCTLYVDDDVSTNKKIVGNLKITFVSKNPSINDINIDVLKKYIHSDIEQKLYKLLYGEISNSVNKYAEQNVDINNTDISAIQFMNLNSDNCNNNECTEFFNNSKCSSYCGKGYRLLNGNNHMYDEQMVVPCYNGECKPEDEIEPLYIFAHTSMVFFCIIFTILILTIYNLMKTEKKNKVNDDPFITYDSNLSKK